MTIIRTLLCVHLIIVLSGGIVPTFAQERDSSAGWHVVAVSGSPVPREDCGFVACGKLLYLLGGRGIKTVDVFDPQTGVWTSREKTPVELHHFQAVCWRGEIYAVGAMSGHYPHEQAYDRIWIYNPKKDQWREGASIPGGRIRGSAGAVVYGDKIYFVGGIQDGHYAGTVPWFDVYDLKTGEWATLPDAPHARDHFHAAVVGHELYVAGGRRTSAKTNQVGNLTEPAVDVYNFRTHTWRTLTATKDLPTVRAGCTAVSVNNKLCIIGGETVDQEASHREVECFDTQAEKWNFAPTLQSGRHDTQALVFGNYIYIAAGSANRGGGPDLGTMERMRIPHR